MSVESPTPEPPLQKTSQQASILLIEDDAAIRETITDVLSDEGYRIASASNGREGLVHLAGGPLPSLIILDVMMPVMDGIEFRRRQVSDPRTAHVPVVVMSAAVNLQAIATDLSAAYLRKPIGLKDLLRIVKENCR